MASATWPLGRAAYNPTLSDSVDLPGLSTAGLYVGAAGSIQVTTEAGNTVSLAAVPAGTYIPLVCRRIWNTGTSISNASILVLVA